MEPKSFEEFHRKRATAALDYARGLLGTDGAEDACQEAWLRAWRAWGSAQDEKVDAWLRAIIRNCCFDAYGRPRPLRPVDEGDFPPESAAEDIVLSAIELVALRARLSSLSFPLREALWMREVLDLPYSEIAERQRVPIGTVMSRLHAARSQARRLRLRPAG